MANIKQKITPYLWFDKHAEEAMAFYTSIFKNSSIVSLQRYPEREQVGPLAGMEGKVLNGIFELEGYTFFALDGGPQFKFNPSISFFVNCDSKEEVDELWEKLSDGGAALMPLDKYDFSEHYGWVQDKYGVSWQLIFGNPEGDWRPKIIPSLLFTKEQSDKTKEAIDFYTSVFHDAKVGMIAPNEKPGVEGAVAFADFMLENQWFAAMGSPEVQHDFTFNEAVSLHVECEDQEEVDHLWERLSAVPESEQCGWLKDKFGLSWQIIPKQLGDLLSSPDKEKAGRAMQAMLQMKKIDIAELQRAYEQEK